MGLPELIRAISGVFDSSVEVHQTHMSVVFVTADRAYKMKKPIDLGFADYSSLQQRHFFCREEVRLNRRLAPDVYLGVRAIVSRDGRLTLGEPDDEGVIEYLVEMRRLEDRDSLLAYFHRDGLTPDLLRRLGAKMAAFHASCDRGEIGRHGAFAAVAKNARDNFSQAEGQIGRTVASNVFEAARRATEERLRELEPLISGRDSSGLTGDTHGDLRLEHIFQTGDALFVIDCIEFGDAFRFSDPVSDIAFLVMDLRIRWGDPTPFVRSYFDARPGGEQLLDFYVAYRSAVRAKVHGIAAMGPELDQAARERARIKSRAHWLFTWATLAPPEKKPALVIVGGLPGIGKSSLAKWLERHAGFTTLDSDVVRKELAGVAPTTNMRAELDAGIYTAEWTDAVYDALLDRAAQALSRGERVAVSATFRANDRREAFLKMAHARGVCGLMIECSLDREEAVRRIRARRGDASDADVQVHDHIAATWEDPSTFVDRRRRVVSTESVERSEREAREVVRAFGLIGDAGA